MANFMRTYVLTVRNKKQYFKIGNLVTRAKNYGKVKSQRDQALHISFSAEKADTESPNNAQVQIWNLSPKNRKILTSKGAKLTLQAGYGSDMVVVLDGDVASVKTSEDGADLLTEIEVADGMAALKDTSINLSFKGKTSTKTIYKRIAKAMGIPVKFSKGLKFKKKKRGYTFSGKAKKALKKIAKMNGHKWSIQNGILEVRNPKKAMRHRGYVISAETGMINSPSRMTLQAGNQNFSGYEVSFFLNGAIGIADKVKLVSKKKKAFLVVYSMSITGDNQSGDWQCTAKLLTAQDYKEAKKAEAEAKKSSKSSGGSGSGTEWVYSKRLKGKKVKALFTCYHPEDADGGGWTAANGERLNPKKHKTCAVPKPQVKYGKYVQVLGTGTKQDGKVYRANDCGGAITVVNGRYHFDLLWPHTNGTFKHNGYAIIGDGSFKKIKRRKSLTKGGSVKAKKLLDFAATFRGKVTYTWGASQPQKGHADCSGFTYYVFKHFGLVSSRLTASGYAHMSKGKKIKSRSKLKPGDMVFFMKGSHVFHVGIYWGNGKYIHCTTPGGHSGPHNQGIKITPVPGSFCWGRRLL